MNKFPVKDKASDEDDYDFPQIGQPRLKVQKKTSHHNFYTITFDEPIREPSYYRDVLETIKEANEGDVIELTINSPGGHLDSAGAIIQAIETSQADIFATIEGQAHSAASMIALACHGVRVGKFANMMVHQASFGVGGPSSSVYAQVDFNRKYLTKVIRDAYKHFLTENEIEQVLAGSEIWLDAEELGVRLASMFDSKSEELKAQIEEMQNEADEVVEKPQPVKKPARKRASAKKQ